MRMKTKTRVWAMLLVIAATLSLVSGCATKPYVMIIDGMKIRQGTFAYYYGYSYATYYSTYGDSTVTYYALTNVSQHVAIYRLFEQYGLELTEEDEQSIEDARQAKIDELGGQAGYAAFLKTIGLTDKLYREILAITPMYNHLKDYLYGEGGSEYMSEEEVRQIYADLYAHEVHIFISTADVETTEDQDALYALAEEAHDRAVAGEDFTDLILEYGDDAYMAEYPEDGYYLAEGDSGSDVIDEALFNLEVGEISDVVTTSNGFFIYKRLPIEEDYLDSVFADGTMYDSYIDTSLSYYLMDVMTDYDIVYYETFYEVDFTTAAAAFMMTGTSSTGSSTPGTPTTGTPTTGTTSN